MAVGTREIGQNQGNLATKNSKIKPRGARVKIDGVGWTRGAPLTEYNRGCQSNAKVRCIELEIWPLR